MDDVSNGYEKPASILNSCSHGHHIVRHVQELLEIHREETVERVLNDCKLEFAGQRLLKRNGSDITASDCRAYLRSVRRVLGYADYLCGQITLAQSGCSYLRFLLKTRFAE